VRTFLKIVAGAAALTVLGCVVALAAFQALVLRDLPNLRSLDDYRPNLITRVYSADGQVIAEFAKERREIVPIERIPSHVVQAFVAAEDDAFYEHTGLDYSSIVRAAWANLRAGGIKQGGSTITQQVAKTFLLTSERTYLRKLKDMVLAMRIEESLNKNAILYLYLNQIYLGSGAYGVEAAAKTYFGVSIEDVTLAEAAMIAGLVAAPSRYTPFRSPGVARRRQELVLRRMLEERYITVEQRDEALTEPIQLVERKSDEVREISSYFAEEVRRYLVERFGSEEVLTGGLQVWTTLDIDHQRAAYEAVRKGLRAHDRRAGFRGPLRSVPREEWEAILAEIEESNGAPPWEDGGVLRALVTEIDGEAEEARLALGFGREVIFGLEDVSWARPPDPTKDGNTTRVKHVRSALKPGYLVRLEKVGGGGDTQPDVPEGRPAPEEFEAARFALFQEPLAEGALLSMDVETGRVHAIIGGYDYQRSQYNRAVQSLRQPGSSFKPAIYAAALAAGYTPATIVYDTPIVYEDSETGVLWKPENYEERFYGPIMLREALARSRNIATIKILRDVGVRPVIRMARALGIRSPLEPDLSLALGSSDVTLTEMVRLYATFPSGGKLVDPIFILEVGDRDGRLLDQNVSLFADELEVPEEEQEVLPQPEPSELEVALSKIRDSVEIDDDMIPMDDQALDPVNAYLMTDLLRAVVQEGTGWRVKQLRRPVGGKTGTTNNDIDAWFMGFTPNLVTGVWVGYDAPRTLGKSETGSRAAAPIFVSYMRKVLRGVPPADFKVPEGIVFARVDRKSGLLAPSGTQKALFQPFREGTAPTDIARTDHTSRDPSLPPRLD
jgi:penicillin-binding protein 1A